MTPGKTELRNGPVHVRNLFYLADLKVENLAYQVRGQTKIRLRPSPTVTVAWMNKPVCICRVEMGAINAVE